eukprot:TRINITY_DN16555_c1_g1_i1.p2 TRINITY_DN16555_c1_g1~~TRINITY_DN16555_c1_g1_i1.p2  ORF type:complete len:324 (+),score=65.92 TRINITY_DN16555_c1_g1_i1:84-974(+)
MRPQSARAAPRSPAPPAEPAGAVPRPQTARRPPADTNSPVAAPAVVRSPASTVLSPAPPEGPPSAFGMRGRGLVNLNLSPRRDLGTRRRRVRGAQGNPNFVPAREHEPWKGEGAASSTGASAAAQRAAPAWPAFLPQWRACCMQRTPRFWWCYGHVEYKATEGEEQCFRQAQLTLRRWLNHARRVDVRVAVVFDVVATRRNLHYGERVGKAIYRYLDDHYDKDVPFAFVGLTDNTARRVGRDIFCRNEELSRKKLSWNDIDDRHLRIVYPDECPRVQKPVQQAAARRPSPAAAEDL